MKKVFATLLLVFALFFSNSQVEAREVFMGNYSDGSAVYLITESISRGGGGFSCTVRAGYDYLQYNFFYRNGRPYYRNNEGYHGYVFGGASPVAANIWNYAY